MNDFALIHSDPVAVRAVMAGAEHRLRMLVAPFGGPGRLDRFKQFFSARTNFMINVGETRPTLYMHGYSPSKRPMELPPLLGLTTIVGIDTDGVWGETAIDGSELAMRTWESAKLGTARASTGSVNYLVRPQPGPNGRYPPGEVRVWPIAEVSIFDVGDNRTPVSDDAMVLPMRAIFDELKLDLPTIWEPGEGVPDGGEKRQRVHPVVKPIREPLAIRSLPMDEVQAAVAAALAAERAAQEAEQTKVVKIVAEARKSLLTELGLPETHTGPAHRAVFNVGAGRPAVRMTPEAEKRGATLDQLKENHDYVERLRRNPMSFAFRSDAGPIDFDSQNSMRVLEESEALEGAPFVPADMLNQIHELLLTYSLVERSGMTRYTTDRLTFNVPTETAAPTAPATVAEEGAYIANEPAFLTNAVTVLKKGSLITTTEEMREDQNLFEPYLVRKVAQIMGLAHNIVLFALIDAVDGVEIATQHVPTKAEILSCYTSLTSPYRPGATWIMNDYWMGYLLNQELTGASHAWWQPGVFGGVGGAGDIESFMGKPLLTESANWRANAAADDEGIIDFINLSEAIAWVDRRGVSIFVDPYGDSLNGRIRYFPSARFNGKVVNSAAISRLDDHS